MEPVGSICYHEQRGTLLLWGGQTFNELWEWNGLMWSRIPPTGPWPPADPFALMTYDPVRQRVVLACDSTTSSWNETWEWTGSGWEQGPLFGPVRRESTHFDVARNLVFLYGVDGDTESIWEYAPGATAAQGIWTAVVETPPYQFLEGSSIAYDAYRRQPVHINAMTWTPVVAYYCSTGYWDHTVSTWQSFEAPFGPQLFPYSKRRAFSAMCFDSDTGQLVLHGGRRHEFVTGGGTNWYHYNDTWVFARQDPGIVVDLPPSKNWCAGTNGVLSISVAGNASVQWYKNKQPIAGATSTILVLGAVTAATAGVYECEVFNSCGGLWSRPCTVSVPQPPAITGQPLGQDRCPGEDVLIVGPGVSGTNPDLKLQRDNSGSWINVPFQYNPVGNFYILPNAQNSQSGWYRFEASNSCGVAYTQPFHIQVGVMIYGGPASVALDPCTVHQYSVTAQGVGSTLTYQWRRGGVALVDDGRISGATTPTLTINGVWHSDEGKYDCQVTDACESVLSGAGWITIKKPQWVRRTSSGPLRRHSTDLVFDAARGVCVLYGGLSPITFSSVPNDETWEWDGVEWTRRFPAHNPGGRQMHELVYDSVRNKVLLFGGWPNGTMGDAAVWEYDGNDWTLLLNAATGGPPTSHGTQGDAAFDPVRGRLIVLTYYPVSGPSLNQTWEFDPVTLAWQMTFQGTGAYWYDTPLAYDAARDMVLGTSYAWYNLSNPHTWRYTGTGWTEILNSQMPDRQDAVLAFDTFRQNGIMFGCCRNSLSTSYAFFRNDTYSFDGATWSLHLPEFHPALADRVQPMGMAFDSKRNAMVVVGNSWNTSVGMNALDTWEYRYLDKVAFDRQPQDQPLTIGGNAQFKVAAAGAGTLTYQWRKGNTPLVNGPILKGGVISGATTDTLTITGLTAANAGVYRCQVSNACGSALSDPADLGTVCYPDCNGDGALTVGDFGCFQTSFITSNPYADCNQDGALTISDFGCFQSRYMAGCP